MRSFKQRLLGRLSGWLLSGRCRRTPKIRGEDLQEADFKASAQDLGVRFGDHLRQTFRFRWLKKHS